MSERKLITARDIIIISAAALLFAAMYAFSPKDGGSRAVISADGREIMTIPLDRDGEYRPEGLIYPVTLTVKDGKIAVTESGCPRRVCMGRGYIGAAGDVIVCLPNKLAVTVKGGDAEYDIIQ